MDRKSTLLQKKSLVCQVFYLKRRKFYLNLIQMLTSHLNLTTIVYPKPFLFADLYSKSSLYWLLHISRILKQIRYCSPNRASLSLRIYLFLLFVLLESLLLVAIYSYQENHPCKSFSIKLCAESGYLFKNELAFLFLM